MSDKAKRYIKTDSVELAEIFGVTVTRVQQLAKEGIISGKKIKGEYVYDLCICAGEYIEYIKSQKRGERSDNEDAENESRKIAADADIKESKAAMVKLELEELEGNMHRSEDVAECVNDLACAVRDMLLSLPGRISVDISSAATPAEVSEIIRLEIYDILNKLSDYKYDPAKIAARVKERQGWRDTEDSEEAKYNDTEPAENSAKA